MCRGQEVIGDRRNGAHHRSIFQDLDRVGGSCIGESLIVTWVTPSGEGSWSAAKSQIRDRMCESIVRTEPGRCRKVNDSWRSPVPGTPAPASHRRCPTPFLSERRASFRYWNDPTISPGPSQQEGCAVHFCRRSRVLRVSGPKWSKKHRHHGPTTVHRAAIRSQGRAAHLYQIDSLIVLLVFVTERGLSNEKRKKILHRASVVVHREMEKPGTEESESGTGPEGKSRRSESGTGSVSTKWGIVGDGVTMPRTARVAPGGMVFHILNCGVARMPLFENAAD